ncbi:MAG: OadG family transporter subunit [Candidatus Gastranaerophilaceae bacterium]|nr:OadG family transporter subunit [Candidatus Gastranaerophilaceae bacterium]
MNSELWIQGLVAMCIGMGTVLSFLCLMIFAMHIMSAIVKKLNLIFPEVIAQPAGVKKVASSNDEEIAVAILSAMFRK